MVHKLPFGPALKHWQTKGQQQVFENLQGCFGPLAWDFGFPRQAGQVELAALPEADHLEKTGKVVNLPHQSFGLHLLLEIKTCRGRQSGHGISGLPDEWDKTDAQCSLQIKGRAQFGGHERRHVRCHQPP